MAVRKVVLEKLKDSERLRFAIAQGMNKKFRTVERWVRDNDEILSSKAVVLIIKEEMGLVENEILIPEEVTA